MKRNHNKSKPMVIIQCYEDRQHTLPLRKAEQKPSESIAKNHSQPKRESQDNAPPPPPMPTVNGHQNGENKKPIPKILNTDLKTTNYIKNGTLTRTPTPDYNNKIESNALSIQKNIKDERAELESLESYKLKNPSNSQPKPPSNYFIKAPNGTATMKKHGRPVSVTIGEYAYGGGSRREPTKLEFLNADKTDGPKNVKEDSLSNQLQSELVLTLSRSNLRKKTEVMGDAGR